ncbi:MAG: nucleoside triphosphate pyrophosphohydrolase [Chloroflexota bacterium]|nr:MAG: nucleoside triphosphate pyrophosphohydrolase [Chloroflexota bacterium]
MGITIVGLGPGDGRYLTREAWRLLKASEAIVVRTAQHPAIDDLPGTVEVISFDDVYETADSFDEVYASIAGKVLRLGREAADQEKEILYAVPGHPLVGESTVTIILSEAAAENLVVRIVDGLSFVEPTLAALELDALEGLQLFDALEIAGYNHPPLNGDRPALLGQLYSRMVAGEVKLALMALYPDDHEVALVHGAGTVGQRVEKVPLYGVDHSDQIGHLTSLFVPPLPYPGTLESLAETVAYLRGPEGCPWDQEQTSQSLRAGLLDEASEVLQAIDDGDPMALREELGDMLYHVVMQARIAAEQEEFRLSEVIGGIVGKLKRRHPHVWGDAEANDSQQVIQNWEQIKDQENHRSTKAESALNNVPLALPALARAQKVQQRVSRVGFDWPDVSGVEAKVQEEIDEARAATTDAARHEEMGDVLFALVNWTRWLHVDAESALRDAIRRFEIRFRLVERLAAERSLELMDLSIGELDELWDEAKAALNGERREAPGSESREAEA